NSQCPPVALRNNGHVLRHGNSAVRLVAASTGEAFWVVLRLELGRAGLGGEIRRSFACEPFLGFSPPSFVAGDFLFDGGRHDIRPALVATIAMARGAVERMVRRRLARSAPGTF